MNTRHLPVRLLQALALITVLCAASPLAALPVSDTTRVAKQRSIQPSFLPGTAIQASSPGITTLGPRLGPQFTSTQPVLAQSNTQQVAAMAQEGRNHTFVISTLALVLGVIVIALLVS